MIHEDHIVAMPLWVRLQYDQVRHRHVLLAPERVLFPCPTSVKIIEKLVEKRRRYRFGDLIDDLVQEFEAPRETIACDVDKMLRNLIVQRFLDVDEV